MQLTKRDLDILRWVNSHRMATVEQVAKKFSMGIPATYRRLRKLAFDGYLKFERIFVDKPGVYLVTAKGVQVSNDELPPTRIRLGSYEHDINLVDLAITLEQKTGGLWRTDRLIRRDKGLQGVGVSGHSPDGVLTLPNGKVIALELELSQKSQRRVEKILKNYARKSEYTEIWYYCGSQRLEERIAQASPKMCPIKLFTWPDMVSVEVAGIEPAQKQLKLNSAPEFISPGGWFQEVK